MLEEQTGKLNQSNAKLNKTLTKNKSKIEQHQQNEQKLVQLVEALREKVEESSILNARLLYTNKALTSASLNERQKNTIAEALSNANTVEEARTIYETLQSTVGSVKSKSRKAPESLNEVVTRSSSAFIPAVTAKAPM